MKRKLIEAIPFSSMKWRADMDRYEAKVIKQNLAGEETLIIDVFKRPYPDNAADQMLPAVRWCYDGKSFATYQVEKKNWSSGGLEYCLEGDAYYCGRISIKFTKVDNDLVFDSIETNRTYHYYGDKGASRKIANFESDIRDRKRDMAYEAKKKRIHNRKQLVQPFPEDFKSWLTDTVFQDKRYLFYETSKDRKTATAICSGCGQKSSYDRKIDPPKHNQMRHCQHCGKPAKFKVVGRAKTMVEEAPAIYIQKTAEGFVSRYMKAYLTASPAGTKISTWEYVRNFYNKKKDKFYTDFNDASCLHDTDYWWDGNRNNIPYGKGHLYPNNLKDVFVDTPFEYCCLDILAKHIPGRELNQKGYLDYFPKRTFSEYLIKMGLYKLTNETCAWYYSCINAAGTTPSEILGINKQRIRRLVQMNGGRRALELLQIEEQGRSNLTDEQIAYIDKNEMSTSTLKDCLQYTSLNKVLNYHRKSGQEYQLANSFLNDWLDYLRMCKVMGHDIQNEFILFPGKLKETHDKLVKEWDIIKDEQQEQKYKEWYQELTKQYSYQSKQFLIMAPQSLDAISKEGKSLHHCVGTYVDQVAVRETIILFLRQQDNPEKSFYTMEVRNGEVRQVRGKCNRDMTPEVKKFVEQFKKARLQKKLHLSA